MGADSFFVIGKSHDICEDYATDGVYDESIPYAIVCDGCSSSEHTDFGARILTKAIEKKLIWLLTMNEDIAFTSNRYITEAQMYANIMGLDLGALNTTALIAYRSEDKYTVHAYGDGVAVAKTKDGYDVYVIEFPSGAPGYMAYALDAETFEKYIKMFGGSRQIHKHKLDNDFNLIEAASETYSFPFDDPLTPYGIEYNREDCEFIAIFSDGVQTFNKTEINGASKLQKSLPLYGVLKMFLSFKGMNGQFVKRRFKRFMKDAARMEWENFDDVSLGVVS